MESMEWQKRARGGKAKYTESSVCMHDIHTELIACMHDIFYATCVYLFIIIINVSVRGCLCVP